MDEMLLLIAEMFAQYCRDHDVHGLPDMCVDPDDGYIHIMLGNECYARVDGEINHSTTETDTTEDQ